MAETNNIGKTVKQRSFFLVSYPDSPEEVSVEIPNDLPFETIPNLVAKSLGLSLIQGLEQAQYQLKVYQGDAEVKIQPKTTLAEAGIRNWAKLVLSPIDVDTLTSKQENSSKKNRDQDSECGKAASRPLGILAMIRKPSLVNVKIGYIYELSDSVIEIGRPHGVTGKPDVDLTPMEPDPENCSSSRIHALITTVDKKKVLTPKPSLNGTHVNGEIKNANQPYLLKDGDLLRFGEVELVYQEPL